MEAETAHVLLRDRRAWLGKLSSLAISPEADLVLKRVPALHAGRSVAVSTDLPAAREVSGIASGPCNAVFVADSRKNQILFVDGLCNERSLIPTEDAPSDLPGHFQTPCGLATSPDGLLVADSGNGRAQSLAFPRLEANWAREGFTNPVGVAIDACSRVVVVDANAVHRLLPDGSEDTSFNQALSSAGVLKQPTFIALGKGDVLFVCDVDANEVFRFDEDGLWLGSLQGPKDWLPGAIACDDDRCYVFDASTASILVFDGNDLLGSVPGWCGPVTAMAVDASGDVLVKSDLSTTFHRLIADEAHVTHGQLLAGPFDAGEGCAWERAVIEAIVPPATELTAEVLLNGTPEQSPASWRPLPSSDALLELLTPIENDRRFISFRVTLTTSSPLESPRIAQVRAASRAECYLDHLPVTYRNRDVDGFLSRWLKELRGEFGHVDEQIDEMARLADSSFISPSSLSWLAQWLGFELPHIATDNERRYLIDNAVELYARRGTSKSIASFVELHTGVRPTIVESFRERRIWILGHTSRLGFDTRLPALDPEGMIVTDSIVNRNGDLRPSGGSVVGASGPMASDQLGSTLFSDSAYRFCIVVDAYRASNHATLTELHRIVNREKPAHTDYRVMLVWPDMRIGLQSVVGVDTIVGGDPPRLQLDPASLGMDTRLPPNDVSRLDDVKLDGTLRLF